MKRLYLPLALLLITGVVAAQPRPGVKPRARELGISGLIGGTPGQLDAITDVTGVEVGQTTLSSGDGAHSSSARAQSGRA